MIETSAAGGREHLAERVRPRLDGTNDERITFVRSDRWIPYTRAAELIRRLEDLLVHPRTHRMPNMLLVGDTNNGKSVVVQRFCRLHPWRENEHGDGNIVPVLLIEAPPIPDEQRLYNAILTALHAPFRPNDRVETKQATVFKMLRRLRVQMLIIDEIHNVLAGSTAKQHHFRNVLKYLGNELQIPIVAVGTRDAFNAIPIDPQLANRFRPEVLPRWQAGTEWDRLVLSFERRLPLRRPSDLATQMSPVLLTKSEGYIGELSALLTLGAVEAIRTGEERITPRILEQIEWIEPSRRRKMR